MRSIPPLSGFKHVKLKWSVRTLPSSKISTMKGISYIRTLTHNDWINYPH